jgi:fluoride exporter
VTGILVLLGAGLGAPARWLLDRLVQGRHRGNFPVGTLVINVLGSLALGVLLGAEAHGSASASLVLLLGTGFCGGFTTFSTFGYETVRLAESRSYAKAVTNVVLSLGLGLLAAYAGWALAQSLFG